MCRALFDGSLHGWIGGCRDLGNLHHLRQAVLPDARHAARQARQLLPDRRGVSVYECGDSGFWHVGHLPFAVRRGLATRDEIYGERETA